MDRTASNGSLLSIGSSCSFFQIVQTRTSSLDLDQRGSAEDVCSVVITKFSAASFRNFRGQDSMPDDPKDVIEFAIRSAFVAYPNEDDPKW